MGEDGAETVSYTRQFTVYVLSDGTLEVFDETGDVNFMTAEEFVEFIKPD
jgi:hypothetical protein